ncbi:MAG: flavodoxin family protein [Defluviitaleaceae bacterium]|nr:flavodoxin family protein [Defluviitaleaceae bacterium]
MADNELKILGINTSPRENGYSAKLLGKALEGAVGFESSYGYTFTTEMYHVASKNHRPCSGCRACKNGKGCVIQDDMLRLHDKMREADGIIFATPIYFYDVTAQCKIIIDRCFAISPLNGNKAGAIITTASSMGTSGAISTMHMIFSVLGITSAGWLSAYAKADEGQAAAKSALELGAKTAWIAQEKRRINCAAFDGFRHIAYGTHTI